MTAQLAVDPGRSRASRTADTTWLVPRQVDESHFSRVWGGVSLAIGTLQAQ